MIKCEITKKQYKNRDLWIEHAHNGRTHNSDQRGTGGAC